MKKYIPAAIFLVLFLLTSLLYTPMLYDKYLAMTKELTMIFEIDQYMKDPEVLVPTYDMAPHNPYLHVAGQAISLERSRQFGKWDGYYIYITPNKLSDSEFFSISLSCRSSDQNVPTELTWEKKNVTSDFISGENYPDGAYTSYIGTFLKDGYAYEITGFVFGAVDNLRDKMILEELEYIIDGMEVQRD
ncbi:hypothetical protein ACHAL6_11865 [Proteiniclasticum sp. C24MP]|uniref:hypothetical protein n=1 Tax=Proteiniclasticum sp. C24MP TaxID=3374101 RepID=UPI003754EBF8